MFIVGYMHLFWKTLVEFLQWWVAETSTCIYAIWTWICVMHYLYDTRWQGYPVVPPKESLAPSHNLTVCYMPKFLPGKKNRTSTMELGHWSKFTVKCTVCIWNRWSIIPLFAYTCKIFLIQIGRYHSRALAFDFEKMLNVCTLHMENAVLYFHIWINAISHLRKLFFKTK